MSATFKNALRRTREERYGTDCDVEASQRLAVENVKNIVNRRRKTAAIVDEWIAAREEHKKWRLEK